VGGEGKAATARATKGLRGNPRRSELRSEVRLQRQLELNDSRGGVAGDEGTRQIGDGVSKGDGEGASRGGHGGGHCEMSG